MKKTFIIILFLLVFAIFVSGCTDILITPEEDLLEQEDDSIAPGKGRLEIYLTDSSEKYKVNNPEAYVAINITIYKIQIHLAGENEEDEGEWIEWILTEPTEYNLIELKDKSILLSEEELASGKYTQIRIFITESSILVEKDEETESEDIKLIEVENEVDFETFDVEIPSVYQTGIKLIHPFEIIEAESTELTLDFDAEKSIIKTGNGSYKLMPVIKIVTISAEETEELAEK